MQSPPPSPLKLASRADSQGFTLIELSIVLVVVGLVIGGVLMGQDLIQSAKVRSQIGQLQSFTQAFNAFRTKYNCIPGDCATASDFGLSTTSRNGDGNGKVQCNMGGHVGGNWDGAYGGNNWEQMNAWHHLGNANLIAGTYNGVNVPGSRPTSMDGYWPSGKIERSWIYAFTIDCASGAGDANPGNSFLIASALVNPTSSAFDAFDYSLTPLQAYAIDSKIDDGFPTTGTVLTIAAYSSPRPITGAGGGNCNTWTGSARVYNISGTAGTTPASCGIAIGKAW